MGRPYKTALDRPDVRFGQEEITIFHTVMQIQMPDGTWISIANLARKHGLPSGVLHLRLKRKESLERALRPSIPKKESARKLTFRGVTKSLKEWYTETGIVEDTIRKRLRVGWSIEDALTKPVKGRKDNERRTESL